MNILRQNKTVNLIYSIPNFLSDFEINQIFNLVKEKNFTKGSIGSNLTKKPNTNFLVSNNISDSNKEVIKRIRETNLKWISLDEKSNWLFKKIIRCINEVNFDNYGYILKFVEDLQLAEYTSDLKGFYSKHNDCGDVYENDNFVDIRKLSFSIQLSDPKEYEGGELKFYGGKKFIYSNEDMNNIAKKDKGTIIFFPSNIIHEVTPVTKGVRYSLTSWIQGPNLL